MIEHRREVQNDFKDDDSLWANTSGPYGHGFDKKRNIDFESVESEGRRGIIFRVGMVNTMKEPERAKFVKDNVLKVNDKIQKNNLECDLG